MGGIQIGGRLANDEPAVIRRHMSKKTGLTVIPFKHFDWHSLSLYAAHVLLWAGFWIAVYRAWSASDLLVLAYALMLLGIGLLIFRGVAFFMNAWVLWSAYISHRETREEEEIREKEEDGHGRA